MFTRGEELAASRGGLGKHNSFGNQVQTGLRQIIQAWPLFPSLRKGGEGRVEDHACFFLKVLRIFRRHLESFKNKKHGVDWGGCCAFVSKGRKEMNFSSLFKFSSLLLEPSGGRMED